MKKLIVVTIAILAAVVAGLLLIRNTGTDTDVTKNTTKVGLMITGTADDGNFCQTHVDALNSIRDELNLDIVLRERIPEDELCYDTIRELIDRDGCRVIVGASFGYGDYMIRAAEEYPEICFIHPIGGMFSRRNLSSFMGRMYQARYLSGIVAGLRTGTGEIAYVAAIPIPEVVRGVNAFTLGVKSVRPDAVVHVKYCNSWVDDDAAEEAAVALFDRYPVDICATHTNSMMPNEEADRRGIWSIGYNKDNAAKYPDTWLTACEWRWAPVYREQIMSFLADKFVGTKEWLSMADGIVGLSPLTGNVADGTEEAVKEAKDRFADGLFDVFHGPIKDNEGNIRVEEGTAMSDDDMLNSFDWYVEGVSVEE